MSSNVASQSLLAKCGFKRGGRRRQTFFREGKYLDDIFFDILKNGLSNNSNYSVIAENGHYVLQLNDALKKEMGIAKAILVFAEGKSDFSNIKSIELNYVNKNPVTLKFKSITKDVTLADSNFSFEAPTNTLINH